MRICLIPLKTELKNPAKNIQQLIERLEQVRQQQPDLVCLPECTLTGYLDDEADLKQFAEPIPGPTTAELSRLARAYQVHICFGLLESTWKGVYNTAILIDSSGAIAGIHRKVNEKPPFVNGTAVTSMNTSFGKLGLLICADLFSEEVITRLDPALRLLLVPMARSFDGQSPDPRRWEAEERQEYLDAVRQAGVPAAIVNTLEAGIPGPSFGGALVVNARGELLAESPHGTDEILIYDFD